MSEPAYRIPLRWRRIGRRNYIRQEDILEWLAMEARVLREEGHPREAEHTDWIASEIRKVPQ